MEKQKDRKNCEWILKIVGLNSWKSKRPYIVGCNMFEGKKMTQNKENGDPINVK